MPALIFVEQVQAFLHFRCERKVAPGAGGESSLKLENK
jgi:hypothetical protein